MLSIKKDQKAREEFKLFPRLSWHGLAPQEPSRYLGEATQGLAVSTRPTVTLRPRPPRHLLLQPCFLRPSPRPHDLQWLGEKRNSNCLLPPQHVRVLSQTRNESKKKDQASHRRKTPSPGNRRTPHNSHRHWAPPYWTNARPPARANQRGAKVSAALPVKRLFRG